MRLRWKIAGALAIGAVAQALAAWSCAAWSHGAGKFYWNGRAVPARVKMELPGEWLVRPAGAAGA